MKILSREIMMKACLPARIGGLMERYDFAVLKGDEPSRWQIGPHERPSPGVGRSKIAINAARLSCSRCN